MRMSFSGVGAAYRPSWGSNSAFFMAEKQLYLIDCGESVFCCMVDRPELSECEAVNILITHLHSDHIGSLGSFISYCRHVLGKPVLVATPDHALAVVLKLTGIEEDEYELRTEFAAPFPGGIRVKPLEVEHAQHMKCFGYYLSDENETIFYSGDANVMPEEVLNRLKTGEVAHVYQETTYMEKQHPSHCSLKKLCGIVPEELRARVTCMHFGEDFQAEARKCGFDVAQVGEVRPVKAAGEVEELHPVREACAV